MAQSKAEESVPFLDELLSDNLLSKHDIARTVRLYASAMYLLNRNSSAHSEMAERALQIARECGDMELLARALFEHARAGVESGRVGMTAASRDELQRLCESNSECVPPIAFLADAFCNYHLLDIEPALQSALRAVAGFAKTKNFGELALGYNALGNCYVGGCHLEQARKAYTTAIDISTRVGDDYRRSLACYNLGSSYMVEGQFDKAVRFIEESIDIAKRAPSQPVFPWVRTSLALAHIILGQRSEAGRCFEAMNEWMRSGRSWAVNMEYYCGAAEIELATGNEGEALKYVAKAEQELHGRGNPFISAGTLDRLRVFFGLNAQGPEVATSLAAEFASRYRGRHHLAYLEMVAAVAWLENKVTGRISEATGNDLRLFQELRVEGKRAILRAQGFIA
jgi:tetratricopeptide (TPR) repeat protein